MSHFAPRESLIQPVYALIDTGDPYIQPLIEDALSSHLPKVPFNFISSLSNLSCPSSPVLQYRSYETLDFTHLLSHPTTSLANAYIIRKALIRKHYLSRTIANWITKHSDSILRDHFKPSVDFELDYAKFLDEALVEAYELRESFERNAKSKGDEKEWWILKPGMSDRGQGIRLLDSEAKLREIFEGWEEDDLESSEEDEVPNGEKSTEGGQGIADSKGDGVMISQLRHFIAQPYIHPPLLLPSSANRKFHTRTYVVATGSLKVYVYREMLALFAAVLYRAPWEEDDNGETDLSCHLTNTCLQDDGVQQEGSTVRRFWDLEDDLPSHHQLDWKKHVYDQICSITGEVFEAAARSMMVHFQTLPNAFEVFGVDFLVDEKLNVWLLEVNAFPDFKQTGEPLKRIVVGGLFQGIVGAAVLPFFGVKGSEDESEEEVGMKVVATLDLGIR